jgi:hypothetical protein
MRAKTTSIPVVLAGAVDPVGAGLAHSLRRPGMNVTGVVQLNDVLPAKHVEIMPQIRPGLARFGQLVDSSAPDASSLNNNPGKRRVCPVQRRPHCASPPQCDRKHYLESFAGQNCGGA